MNYQMLFYLFSIAVILFVCLSRICLWFNNYCCFFPTIIVTQDKRITVVDALAHPYLDEGRLRYHSCMCTCCYTTSAGMRQYRVDFEPSAAHPFDDLWERKLTSVQQVKGEKFHRKFDVTDKKTGMPGLLFAILSSGKYLRKYYVTFNNNMNYATAMERILKVSFSIFFLIEITTNANLIYSMINKIYAYTCDFYTNRKLLTFDNLIITVFFYVDFSLTFHVKSCTKRDWQLEVRFLRYKL